jgi:iron complex outermembrane receptor protein
MLSVDSNTDKSPPPRGIGIEMTIREMGDIVIQNRSRMRFRNALLAATTLASTSLAVTANAQTADTGQIQEVIVTARSRAENLQNVPLAVTALTGATLTEASATSLQDISFLTPGLVFSSNGAQANEDLVIRGISDTSGGEASATNVAVFLDGVYIANPSAVDLAIGGVERVEVVEGPVSGLYGRNAFAGAVNYITQKPTDAFHFNIADTFGDYGKEQLDAGISGAIIPGLLKGRLVGTYDTFDGTYHDNISGQNGNGDERKDWLGTLVFTPLKNLTITPVIYSGQDHFDNNATVTYAQNCAFTTGDSYCGDLGKNQLGPFLEAPHGSDSTGLNRTVFHFHLDAKYVSDYGTIDALFGFNRVKTKSYSNFDGQEYGLDVNLYNAANQLIGTTYSEERFGNHATETDTSMELRYDSPQNLPIRVSLGGYYLNEGKTNESLFAYDLTNVPSGDHLNASFLYTSGGQAAGLGESHNSTFDGSAFIGGEWDIVPTLTLAAVVRDTSEEATEDEQSGAPTTFEKTFHSITSNESLTWKVQPGINLYASAANGSKAGGFNGASASSGVDTYAPETDWDYEVGAKTTMLGGHLRLNGDVFHLDIDNIQQIGPQPDGVALVVTNQGSVSETGVEGTADWVVGNGLRWSGGFTYSPARYSSGNDYSAGAFSAADVNACQSLAYCAGRVSQSASGPYVRLKGLQLPNSSDFVFNTTVEYRHPLNIGHDVEWFVRGDYRYESKEYATVIDNAYYGPRNVLNLHAGLEGTLPVGRWTATAYVLNLLDDKTPVDEQANAAENFDGSPIFPNRPSYTNAGGIAWIPTAVLPDGRTFAIRLEYKY